MMFLLFCFGFFFFLLIISLERLFFTLKISCLTSLKCHQDEPYTMICQSFCEEKIAFSGTQGHQALSPSMERQADNKILAQAKPGLKARSRVYLCGSRGHGPG